jgi:hypothetical protein
MYLILCCGACASDFVVAVDSGILAIWGEVIWPMLNVKGQVHRLPAGAAGLYSKLVNHIWRNRHHIDDNNLSGGCAVILY